MVPLEKERESNLINLIGDFGLTYPNVKTLEICHKALTHSSYEGWESSNQRLEFVGDRVLNLILADYLFHRKQKMSEGDMSRRMDFAGNDNLGDLIPELGLNLEGNILCKTALTPDIIADAFEALIGALYLCYPFEKIRDSIHQMLTDKIDSFNPDTNYIGRLQEIAMKNKMLLPDYKDLPEQGAPHQRVFTVRVTFQTKEGTGQGRSKREARQQAASKIITLLKEDK